MLFQIETVLRRIYPVIVVVLIALYFIACENAIQKKAVTYVVPKQNIPCEEWVFLCGHRIDTLIYEKSELLPGEKVKDIFKRHHYGDSALTVLKKKTKDFFDFTAVKPGDQYFVAHLGDAEQTMQLFVLKKSPTEYLVCEFGRDSISAILYKKPVSIKERQLALELDAPLPKTLKQQKIQEQLSQMIVEAYADKLDVRSFKKGDKFKIIYTEKMVEGESLGIDEIKGMIYSRGDKQYYSVHYMAPDDTSNYGYYDEAANSLNKFFLKSPIKGGGRLASKYNMNRFHPVLKVFKAHLGTDFAAPTGTPILSTAKGVVVEAGYKINNGNYVKVQHNKTYTTQYLHMSKIGKNMKPGTHVRQGQVIGYVGSTGLATGPHVCYRFWKNGKQVDPFKEKASVANPIEGEYLKDYLQVFSDISYKLEMLKYPSEIAPETVVLTASNK